MSGKHWLSDREYELVEGTGTQGGHKMKMQITVTKTLEYPDNEADLKEMGWSSTDPRDVAREQQEWINDGRVDVLELLTNATEAGIIGTDAEDDSVVVKWWDEQLSDWRTP